MRLSTSATLAATHRTAAPPHRTADLTVTLECAASQGTAAPPLGTLRPCGLWPCGPVAHCMHAHLTVYYCYAWCGSDSAALCHTPGVWQAGRGGAGREAHVWSVALSSLHTRRSAMRSNCGGIWLCWYGWRRAMAAHVDQKPTASGQRPAASVLPVALQGARKFL